MAGLGAALGMMLGGGMEGYGKAVQDDAIALRDSKLRMLEREQANKMQIERDEADRAFRREEGDKNRSVQSRQYLNDGSTGATMMVEGDSAKPVLTQDGSPLRASKTQNKTDFDKKLEIGMEIFDGDRKRAAEYAAGIRGADAQDMEKMAQDLAKSRATGVAGLDGKRFDEELPKAREEIRSILGSESKTTSATSSSGSQLPPPNAAQIMQMAKDAIAKGAPRERVLDRLKSMGIDTSKVDF